VEETGESTRWYLGERDPASKEGLSEITSGSSPGQQRLGTTCKVSRNEAYCRRRRETNGSGHMSQYERRRRANALPGDGPRLPNGLSSAGRRQPDAGAHSGARLSRCVCAGKQPVDRSMADLRPRDTPDGAPQLGRTIGITSGTAKRSARRTTRASPGTGLGVCGSRQG